METDYKLTKNYIDSLKKHIKELHMGSKEELIQRLETYDQNLTQKVVKKNKVLFQNINFSNQNQEITL